MISWVGQSTKMSQYFLLFCFAVLRPKYLCIPLHYTPLLRWSFQGRLDRFQIPDQSKNEPSFWAPGRKRPCIGTNRPKLAIGQELLQKLRRRFKVLNQIKAINLVNRTPPFLFLLDTYLSLRRWQRMMIPVVCVFCSNCIHSNRSIEVSGLKCKCSVIIVYMTLWIHLASCFLSWIP